MPHSRSRWQQGHHNANQGEGRPLSAKWKMHRSQYERSSEFLHVRHRSVVLRGVRYRRQAGCRQCSPWDEQARVSNVSTAGDGPHQFGTRNDHSTVQRTQSNSNKKAEKTTELIDFRSLITVCFLVRVQAGPPAFVRSEEGCREDVPQARAGCRCELWLGKPSRFARGASQDCLQSRAAMAISIVVPTGPL
jgi:hypothetical protein